MTLKLNQICSPKTSLCCSWPAIRSKSEKITNSAPYMTNPISFFVRPTITTSVWNVLHSTQGINLSNRIKTSLWLRKSCLQKSQGLTRTAKT
jgi:hypothetical protein